MARCVLVMSVVVAVAACQQPGPAPDSPEAKAAQVAEAGAVSLPTWLTRPRGSERLSAPLFAGMRVPVQLASLARRYGVPSWAVYGVVRTLGAREVVVTGVYKQLTLKDEVGSSQMVVDDITYDVSASSVRRALADMAAQLAKAKSKRERLKVLDGYVASRFGRYLLFDYRSNGSQAGGKGLLLASGQAQGALESFDSTQTLNDLALGWVETAEAFFYTGVGRYRYSDPVGSFIAVDEDCILEFAKSIIVKSSTSERSFKLRDEGAGMVNLGVISEEFLREEVLLRIRGLEVVRRAVLPREGLCSVTLKVARSGVVR